MRNATVWAAMFGVENSTVIDGVSFEDEGDSIVVSVRPRKGAKQRCGLCQRRCPRYDHGLKAAAVGGVRIWACCGVAWMATRTSKSTLEVLLRIAWRTVGAIADCATYPGLGPRARAARTPAQTSETTGTGSQPEH